MTTCSLTLIPYNKQPFTIGLLENDGRFDTLEKLIEHSAVNNCIFSDLSYEFVLNYENVAAVKDVYVYVNDTYESSFYSNGKICFPTSINSDRKIFIDCYGYVGLNLTIVLNDESEIHVSSEYMPVLVRRGELNESVKAMVDYVYKHQEALLLNGKPKPKNLAGLTGSKYSSLSAQILFAEKIAAIYETSYGYFKANSRFHIVKVPTVDRLEKLQYVSPVTLEYIASHPEQLKQVNNIAGIRIGNRVFQPQKTLSYMNIYSYDIYENRVVLGFLRKMIDAVTELSDKCKRLLQQIPDDEDYSMEYIYSSFVMFAETRKTLKNGISQLSYLYEKFIQLWGMYHNALMITPEPLINKPQPTKVFMNVPQYNKIYIHIHMWFSFGIYDFSNENFILSFIKISSLYESYLLLKMISYFQNRGYTFLESKRCVYPTLKRWKYKNTSFSNTFSFAKGSKKITLYYQPVVFDTDKSVVNGIGLYRNNNIPAYIGDIDDGWQGAHYYCPDYIIKINDEGDVRYLIADAKFSDLNTITKKYVQTLVFKYLFSISPISRKDHISGMCIIYGKSLPNEQLQSIYNKQLPENIITPFAETLPLFEGIAPESQNNMLDQLINKAMMVV